MRIIPKKTRVTLEFFKGIEIPDLIVGLIGGLLILAVLMSQFPGKLWSCTIIFVLTVALIAPIDDQKAYVTLLWHIWPDPIILSGEMQRPEKTEKRRKILLPVWRI